MTDGALLACEDLRVAAEVDGLTLRVQGPRALVLGAPRALFLAAAGKLPVLRGSLVVDGAPDVAACPADARVPPSWTATEYLVWCARLAGHDHTAARTRAAGALDRMKLTFAPKQRIDRLPAVAQRALVVAGALARGARVVLLEDPLAGLPEETAEAHARIVLDALEDVATVIFAPRVRTTSQLMTRASEVVVVDGGTVTAQGSPAEVAARSGSFALRAEGTPDAVAALVAHVEARGGALRPAGPSRLTLDLGPSLTTAELLGAALEADVLVVEMRPVGRALA